MKSRINNPYRMKQLIDFQELDIDGYIYPTELVADTTRGDDEV